jgi:adhesin/invasin
MYVLRSPAAAAAPVETVTVTLSPSKIVADGVSSSTATAAVSFGRVRLIGQTVVFSSSDGGIRFGPTIDNLNGTYTAMLTSSRVAGVATVTATTSSGANKASGQTTLAETPGPASSMALSVAPPSITANGTSYATATVTVADGNGNPIPTDAVTFSSSDPGQQIVGTANNGGGTYSALIRSSTTPGQVVITATDTNANRIARSQLTQTAAQAPGSPSTGAPGSSTSPGSMLSFVTMQWSFRSASAYTNVLSLVVNGAPADAVVLVACDGRGCPFSRRAPSAAASPSGSDAPQPAVGPPESPVRC